MNTYRIAYLGTVLGQVVVEAESLEDAIKKADDECIDILDYPDDWYVDRNITLDWNKEGE